MNWEGATWWEPNFISVFRNNRMCQGIPSEILLFSLYYSES